MIDLTTDMPIILSGAAFLTFLIGIAGMVTCKNLIRILLSAEIMFAGIALNFVTFSAYRQSSAGTVFATIILSISAIHVCAGAIAGQKVFDCRKPEKSRENKQ